MCICSFRSLYLRRPLFRSDSAERCDQINFPLPFAHQKISQIRSDPPESNKEERQTTPTLGWRRKKAEARIFEEKTGESPRIGGNVHEGLLIFWGTNLSEEKQKRDEKWGEGRQTNTLADNLLRGTVKGSSRSAHIFSSVPFIR